jgi:hypothetical protein
MVLTGLSADREEYRRRLGEQSDDQLDAWAAELMRDVAARRGVRRVLDDLFRVTGLSEAQFERVFAAGGAPPAVVGRDPAGELLVPAVALWAVVPGLRALLPDARERIIDYLVENFEELVYI